MTAQVVTTASDCPGCGCGGALPGCRNPCRLCGYASKPGNDLCLTIGGAIDPAVRIYATQDMPTDWYRLADIVIPGEYRLTPTTGLGRPLGLYAGWTMTREGGPVPGLKRTAFSVDIRCPSCGPVPGGPAGQVGYEPVQTGGVGSFQLYAGGVAAAPVNQYGTPENNTVAMSGVPVGGTSPDYLDYAPACLPGGDPLFRFGEGGVFGASNGNGVGGGYLFNRPLWGGTWTFRRCAGTTPNPTPVPPVTPSFAAAAPAPPCRFRPDEPAPNSEVAAEGLSTQRDWFRCRKPNFERLGMLVSECGSCGVPAGRRCGSAERCPGFAAADPDAG